MEEQQSKDCHNQGKRRYLYSNAQGSQQGQDHDHCDLEGDEEGHSEMGSIRIRSQRRQQLRRRLWADMGWWLLWEHPCAVWSILWGKTWSIDWECTTNDSGRMDLDILYSTALRGVHLHVFCKKWRGWRLGGTVNIRILWQQKWQDNL